MMHKTRGEDERGGPPKRKAVRKQAEGGRASVTMGLRAQYKKERMRSEQAGEGSAQHRRRRARRVKCEC